MRIRIKTKVPLSKKNISEPSENKCELNRQEIFYRLCFFMLIKNFKQTLLFAVTGKYQVVSDTTKHHTSVTYYHGIDKYLLCYYDVTTICHVYDLFFLSWHRCMLSLTQQISINKYLQECRRLLVLHLVQIHCCLVLGLSFTPTASFNCIHVVQLLAA